MHTHGEEPRGRPEDPVPHRRPFPPWPDHGDLRPRYLRDRGGQRARQQAAHLLQGGGPLKSGKSASHALQYILRSRWSSENMCTRDAIWSRKLAETTKYVSVGCCLLRL